MKKTNYVKTVKDLPIFGGAKTGKKDPKDLSANNNSILASKPEFASLDKDVLNAHKDVTDAIKVFNDTIGIKDVAKDAVEAAYKDVIVKANKYNSKYRSVLYALCLAQEFPILALLRMGTTKTMRIGAPTDKDGNYKQIDTKRIDAIKAVDLEDFEDFIDKLNEKADDDKKVAIFPEDWRHAIYDLRKDICAKALYALASDINGDIDPDTRIAATEKLYSALSMGNYSAAREELVKNRSNKVSKAMLNEAISALIGEEAVEKFNVYAGKLHVTWLENVIIGKGKTVFSVSLPKESTMIKLVAEIIIAITNNLELEVTEK